MELEFDQKQIPSARKFAQGMLKILELMDQTWDSNTDEVDVDYAIPLEKLPKGPWIADHQAHPRQEYRFKASGYRCSIKRPPHDWVWNGYITLPENHPDLKQDEETLNSATDVHGGFTYANDRTLGFDTQHYNDIVPGLLAIGMPRPDAAQYWTFDMVLREVQRVAAIFKTREMQGYKTMFDVDGDEVSYGS